MIASATPGGAERIAMGVRAVQHKALNALRNDAANAMAVQVPE